MTARRGGAARQKNSMRSGVKREGKSILAKYRKKRVGKKSKQNGGISINHDMKASFERIQQI